MRERYFRCVLAGLALWVLTLPVTMSVAMTR